MKEVTDMYSLKEEDQLYVKQMDLWIEEQRMVEKQLKDTVDYHVFLASSNTEQLRLHRERVTLGIKEYQEWKGTHGL